MGTQTNQLEKETKATVSKQKRNSTGRSHLCPQRPDGAQRFIEDRVSLDAARREEQCLEEEKIFPGIRKMKLATRSPAAARSALTRGGSPAAAPTRSLVPRAEAHARVRPSPSGQGPSEHIALGPQTASRKRPRKEDLTKGHGLLPQQQGRGTAGTAFESSSPHSACPRHRPEEDEVQAPLGVCRQAGGLVFGSTTLPARPAAIPRCELDNVGFVLSSESTSLGTQR